MSAAGSAVAQDVPRETTAGLTEIAPPASEPSLMTMLADALRQGQPIEVIRELKAMAKEFAADAARMAFASAFAAAKAEITPIVRRRDGHNSKYADFGDIASEVDPILSRHGLSYRHRSETNGNIITVICRLTHTGGHYEETPLPAPPDTSGAKNALTAIGSTLTYLQRYTLLLALGLATSKDTDGTLPGDLISDEQRNELLRLIDDKHADVARFCAYFKIPALPALPSAKFEQAKKMIGAKK